MPGWSAGGPGGPALFWNPGAISYLAELVLVVVLAAYIAVRLGRHWRQRRVHPATLTLTVLIAALFPGFLASLLRLMTAGGWVSYAMPWSPLAAWTTLAMPWARPFAGITAAAFVLFAYQVPRPLPGARLEARAMAALLAALLLAEGLIAARTDAAIMTRVAWWRPDWLAGWMNVAMIWTGVVFWRQLAVAQRDGAPPPARRWARLGTALAAIGRRAGNREAAVARAFLILTLLPVIHTTLLFLPSEGQFGVYPLDIFICWAVLTQLLGLLLVFVGFLPERSSFLFKLTAICLALMLAAVNGAVWIVAPAYHAAFRAPGMVAAGQAFRFTPVGGGYRVAPLVLAPAIAPGRPLPAAGARIVLPFTLRFYGRRYSAVHVGDRGTIGFAAPPRPSDAAFESGAQPAIYPLLVDLPAEGTALLAAVAGDRLVITRRDRCTGPRCYRVQTVLHADGRIDVHYLQVPEAPAFALFSPLAAPWLVGITPGAAAPAAAGPALLRDYYRAFLAYLDRLYAPIVPFMIAAALALLAGMPLLFRGFLVRPLERLLHGMRRFRGGGLDAQVAVSFNDEIGYLTESFNEMARAQQSLLVGLEQRVADRVAEIGEVTARNAQLEERNRLSAELHDAVAQTIASASLLASALPAQLAGDGDAALATAGRIARLSRHALGEMQTLLRELRSEDGDSRLLTERLGALARSFAQLHGLEIDAELHGDAPLPIEVRAMLYRVAQESLNNVVKHSGATHVTLLFEGLADRALLVVSDNGRGFDAALAARGQRLGLTIMRDRAQRIGATLEIESRPDHGCRITMIWVAARGG